MYMNFYTLLFNRLTFSSLNNCQKYITASFLIVYEYTCTVRDISNVLGNSLFTINIWSALQMWLNLRCKYLYYSNSGSVHVHWYLYVELFSNNYMYSKSYKSLQMQ